MQKSFKFAMFLQGDSSIYWCNFCTTIYFKNFIKIRMKIIHAKIIRMNFYEIHKINSLAKIAREPQK